MAKIVLIFPQRTVHSLVNVVYLILSNAFFLHVSKIIFKRTENTKLQTYKERKRYWSSTFWIEPLMSRISESVAQTAELKQRKKLESGQRKGFRVSRPWLGLVAIWELQATSNCRRCRSVSSLARQSCSSYDAMVLSNRLKISSATAISRSLTNSFNIFLLFIPQTDLAV